MKLAHARLRDAEHGRDFLEVELVVVVQAHQQFFALRQLVDAAYQRALEPPVVQVRERRIGVVRHIAVEIRLVSSGLL